MKREICMLATKEFADQNHTVNGQSAFFNQDLWYWAVDFRDLSWHTIEHIGLFHLKSYGRGCLTSLKNSTWGGLKFFAIL